MCVTGLAVPCSCSVLSSHYSPVINPILPLVRSPHLSTARKAGTVRQEIASSFPVPFLSFSTSHSFRFPLLPSLPLPGLLSVIYPLHPPRAGGLAVPKQPPYFFRRHASRVPVAVPVLVPVKGKPDPTFATEKHPDDSTLLLRPRETRPLQTALKLSH